MKWRRLKGINLPDITANIGLLLGNDVPDILAPLSVKKGPKGSPLAIKSKLGWIVYNLIKNNGTGTYSVNRTSVVELDKTNEFERLVKMYQESINFDFPERMIDEQKEFSENDKLFMEKVSHSMCKVDGRYEMCLPFKEKQVRLPDNKIQAEQRLVHLKRKMEGDVQYRTEYTKFMTDVIDKGYAEKVPQTEVHKNDGKVFYIPHFGVYHPKKPDKTVTRSKSDKQSGRRIVKIPRKSHCGDSGY